MEKISRVILFAALFFMFASPAAGEETSLDGLSSLRGAAFERAFYSEELPYHEAAVAMSRLAISRTKDPSIGKWAEEIVRTLTAEVGEIRMEAEKRGGVDRRLYAAAREESDVMMRQSFSDRRYAEQIIRCFGLAIERAELAPGRTEDARLLELAWRIVRERSRLRGEFEVWMAE